MVKFAFGLLALAIAMASFAFASPGGLYLTTDKSNYAFGEQVMVTATNNGISPVEYTTCYNGIFFKVTDSNGNVLQTENPMIKTPCRINSLQPGQSITRTWPQTYYVGESGEALYVSTAGVYTASLQSASVRFSIGATSASGLTLSTDKQSYHVGEEIQFIATNNGKDSIIYSMCNPTYTIVMHVGDADKVIYYRAPSQATCQSLMVLPPGRTAVIGTWDQKYYPNYQDCVTNSQFGSQCASAQAQAGSYTVSFKDARANFAIVSPTAFDPKTFCTEPKAFSTAPTNVNTCTYKGRVVYKVDNHFLDSGVTYYYDDGSVWMNCGGMLPPVAECDLQSQVVCSSVDLCAQPTPSQFALHLNQGWNLVSEPLYGRARCYPTTASAGSYAIDENGNCIVADAASIYRPGISSNTCGSVTTWYYDGNSYQKGNLGNWDARYAYWIKASGSCDLAFAGTNAITSQNYELNFASAGWHMIGAPTGSTPFNQLQGTCAGHVTSGPWIYSNGDYSKASSLNAGSGYWIKTNSACTLSGIDKPPQAP